MASAKGCLKASAVAAGVVLLLVGALVVSCALVPDATDRIARHLELDDVSSTLSIENELISRFPVGTPEAEIRSFLARDTIAQDRHSKVYADPAKDFILLHVDLDPASLGIVKESYSVAFHLDERRTLKSVAVKKMLTGP